MDPRSHFVRQEPRVSSDPRILVAMSGSNPWYKKIGVMRLTFLGDLPPPASTSRTSMKYMPPGVDMEEWWHALHEHANARIVPELLNDKWILWRQSEDIRDAPDWMTMTPDSQLQDYEDILRGTLNLDDRGLTPFVTLVRRGPLGYSEACRILYHGLKDKNNTHDPRFPRGPDGEDLDPTRHSRWFKKASEEALEALDNPDAWQGPRIHSGPKGWSKGKGPDAPGTSSSSGPSTNPWASYSGSFVPPSRAQGASSSSSSAKPFPYRTGFR